MVNHEKVSPRDVAGDHFSSTSAHGIPRIYSSKSMIRKICWSIVFVASFSAFGVYTSTLVLKYFSYQSITEMSITFNKEASFPSITICNQNPIRMSKIKQSAYLNDLLSSQMPDMMATFDERMTSMSSELGSSFFPNMGDWTNQVARVMVPSTINSGATTAYENYQYPTQGGMPSGDTSQQAEQTTLPPRNSPPPVTDYGAVDNISIDTIQNTTETINNITLQTTGSGATDGTTDQAHTPEVSGTTEDAGGFTESPDFGNPFGKRRKRDALEDNAPLNRHERRADFNYEYVYESDLDTLKEERSWQEDATDKMRKTYFQFLSQVNYTDRAVMGHQKDDFILKCTFNGMECSNTSFVQSLTYNLGNCYTFNHRTNGEQGLTVTRAGSDYGLSLDLNIEQYEYLSGITDTAGVRVVIHSHDEKPYPQNYGISLAPGFSTRIGLKQRVIERLGIPWGNCSAGVNHYTPPGYNYSAQSCLNNCLQSEVVKVCGCRYLAIDWKDETIRPCNDTMKSTDELCFSNLIEQYISDVLECNCPSKCDDTEYQLSFSQAKWPSLNEQPSFERELARKNERLKFLMGSGSNFAKAENNFAQLKVFYQELNFERIREVEEYGWANLLGDIGGQLGLWIGFSIITVTEFLELLYDLTMIALYKLRHPRKVRKVKEAPPEKAINYALS